MFKLFSSIVTVISIFALTDTSRAQWIGNDSGMCPNGHWVYQGTAAMCVPDQPQQPICPANTSYCSNVHQCCNPGFYCSVYGCIAEGSIECGGYSCQPGLKCGTGRACLAKDEDDCGNGRHCKAGNRCWQEGGKLSCVSAAHAYGHEHAKKLVKWLNDNKARLKGAIAERHEKGLDYIASDPQVKDAIKNLQILAAAYGVGGPGAAEAAEYMLAIKGAFQANSLFAANHYLGSLAAVKEVSSALLGVAPVPPGSSEVLALAGAATTAYTYGFFFSP